MTVKVIDSASYSIYDSRNVSYICTCSFYYEYLRFTQIANNDLTIVINEILYPDSISRKNTNHFM